MRFAIFILALSFACPAQTPSGALQLWQEPLLTNSAPARGRSWARAKAIYTPLERSAREREFRWVDEGNIVGLAFMQDDRLVVYGQVPTQPDPHGAVRSWALRLRWFSPAEGRLLATHAWRVEPASVRTGTREVRVVPARGGIVIQIYGHVVFLSNRLRLLRTWPMPSGFAVTVSPSRRTVVIYAARAKGSGDRVAVLDGHSFAVMRRFDTGTRIPLPPLPLNDAFLLSPGGQPFSLIRGSAAAPRFDPKPGTTLLALLSHGRGLAAQAGPKPFCDNLDRRPFASVRRLHRGSQPGPPPPCASLVLMGQDETRTLLEVTGAQSFDAIAGIAVSEDARYAAVNLTTIHPHSAFWGIPAAIEAHRVEIFDLTTGQPVAATPLVAIPTKNAAFALSPDGEYLAVLQDDWVAMYSLGAPGFH